MDEVSQEQAALPQFTRPLIDAIYQQRDLAQALQYRLLGRLDALGEGDLRFTGEQFTVAHLPEVGVDEIAREADLPILIGLGRDLVVREFLIPGVAGRRLVRPGHRWNRRFAG